MSLLLNTSSSWNASLKGGGTPELLIYVTGFSSANRKALNLALDVQGVLLPDNVTFKITFSVNLDTCLQSVNVNYLLVPNVYFTGSEVFADTTNYIALVSVTYSNERSLLVQHDVSAILE